MDIRDRPLPTPTAPVAADQSINQCLCSLRATGRLQAPPTYLAGGHHVPVLGVLVHRQAEDVVRVLQVEALAP